MDVVSGGKSNSGDSRFRWEVTSAGSCTLHVRSKYSMTGSADELQARKSALEDLIHLWGPVVDALKQLRAFDWDGAPDLVTLLPATVIEVPDRYLSDAVTAEEIGIGQMGSRSATTSRSRRCSTRS